MLVFLPVVGFVLYMLFGHSYVRKERLWYSASAVRQHKQSCSTGSDLTAPLEMDTRYVHLIRLNHINDEAPLTCDNRITVYTNGADKFRDLAADIRRAKKYIHLLYFIFRTDSVGGALLDLLAQKAAQGVDVKIVYDGMGNVAVSAKGFDKVRAAGGRIFRYSPLVTSIIAANYRNHRKLAIIDGEIGYIGGMNIGAEYAEGKGTLSPWRDTHLRITGSAVRLMEGVFIGDYLYAANEQDTEDETRRWRETDTRFTGSSPVQIVTSAPEHNRYHIHDAYAKMITAAEHSLYIQTPHLIPDRTIMDGLRVAAVSGVDVRIIIPAFPDKFFVYMATLSYAREPLSHGVKIYRYKGFIHSKMVLADDTAVSIGSANLDLRSFFLNFEANAFIYDRAIAASQREQFFRDIANSTPMNETVFSTLPLTDRLLMPVCRLFSPLL